VISWLGQALPRLVPSSNVAGGSLLERLRSTSFALCGAVTAIGLGLVALAANQGWPSLLDSAIPAVPRERVHNAQIVAGPSGRGGGPSRSGARAGTRHRSGGFTRATSGGFTAASGARLASHKQIAGTSPGSKSPAIPPGGHVATPGGHGGGGAPASPTPEQPASATPQPVASPTPVSTPVPTEQPPAEESSSGHGKAKGHEKHSLPASEEGPPPVKEKHSHGPPPAPPVTQPAPPAEPEAPAEPESVPPGHAKPSASGKAHGHGK
jgi:hypothetical protein